jgi:undecaprenyl-diphosphatase
MSIFQAIILGLVQGLAEFLPVSSSGHLVLFQDILGLRDVPLLFDIVLHLATLLAVLLVFRRRIWAILVALWHWATKKKVEADAENLALVLPLLGATAVTAVIGFVIQKYVADKETVHIVSIELLITAAALIASAFIKPGSKGYRQLGVKESLIVGIGQGLGVFNGISRSGFTISAALLSGLKREEAGEFAFLLAIPAILGAFVLELKDLDKLTASVPLGPMALSAFVAFVSGLLALTVLLRIIKKGKLAWFAAWLIPVGLAGLFLL